MKVLSFELAYSLPAGTRTLAELGAEVVRVGGPSRDNAYVGVVDGVYLSKTCVGIYLKHHDGLAVAKHLVTKADVVCSNFVPGVMERLGLGPREIGRLSPSAIVLQLSGYGSPGPWSSYPAFGPSTEAAGGMNQLMGRDPDPPVRVGSGVFSDQLAGRFAALSLGYSDFEVRLTYGASQTNSNPLSVANIRRRVRSVRCSRTSRSASPPATSGRHPPPPVRRVWPRLEQSW